MDQNIADEFFAAVVRQAKLRRYISSDHFSVDGTLSEAWASHKSFKPKDSEPDGDGPKGRNVRAAGFTPHVAQNNTNRRSAIDGRTTRHAGYKVSQRIRKRVEEPFGWVKTVGQGRKLRYIGQERNRAWFKMTTAVYNVIRITALDAATA